MHGLLQRPRAGPFVEAADDDHHGFRRVEPVKISSKACIIFEHDGYRVNGDSVTSFPTRRAAADEPIPDPNIVRPVLSALDRFGSWPAPESMTMTKIHLLDLYEKRTVDQLEIIVIASTQALC